jgi:hypothetical protein
VRLPVLAENRAYLKALREAELAIWNAPRIPRPVAMNLNPTFVRLPAPSRDEREGWLYALLAALCLLVLGHELWATFQAAGNWSNFVEFVRQLLA